MIGPVFCGGIFDMVRVDAHVLDLDEFVELAGEIVKISGSFSS